ncbi:SurA N-terminal domain-containing protein [Congregibacter litoralis]|uniref:Periplasmic chaperone PpiD n=1 Tax=Congregibacter litoralis KT71 TaxID=314285 RepID=A4A351_9GAMM|nr:SurA N-terminal domain-containing protein [Congregibacter litoralis]EAQ99088.1 Parvulin-like peptidyl-prolyl isomerase [Congregibacter litoralis KT71]
MLQDIRANAQGTVAKIIIGLIVISFSIFGIESLLFSGGSDGVAEVNGEEITPFALQQEVSVQQRRLLSILGENADPALLDQAQLSQQALETLIQREIIKQAAADLELTTSDQALADIIGSMGQFQIDGQFSPDMFQSALASAGFTPALFRERLSEDVEIGQLRAGIAGSDFTTAAELELASAIALEGRDVRYVSLPLIDFMASVEVSDEAVEAFYNDNPERFQSEEQLVLEYVEITLDRYIEDIDEERVREEFELVRDEFELATEARVSHILVEGDDEERAARIAEAQAALDAGMSFAEAAAEYSDDIGSSQFEGDLGYTAGDTFPEAMEDAVANLAVGERSAPVETEAGTHLLLVTDRREGSNVSFEEVAEELEDRIARRDAAAELLSDVERLRDIAFNAADLDAPAEALELTVQTSDPVTRNQREGLFSRPVLLQAAFSEDVLEAGHNSEVLELSPEQFVLLRVAERRPPAQVPLESVAGEIEDLLRDRLAREAAAAEARELLAALDDGNTVEEAANAAGFQWQVELGARRDSPTLPPVVRERLFSMAAPTDGNAVREIVSDDPDATYIVELARVNAGDPEDLPAEEQNSLRQRIAGETGGTLQQQYERSLRERVEVIVY